MAIQFFGSNTAEIDQQLDADLATMPFVEREDAPGKAREYPIGTVARVRSHGRTFYYVAMARLNDNGTAGSTVREVEDALSTLWAFITEFGELKEIAIPIVGTVAAGSRFHARKWLSGSRSLSLMHPGRSSSPIISQSLFAPRTPRIFGRLAKLSA